MKTKIKKLAAKVNELNKKQSEIHSLTYMNIFLLVAAMFAFYLNETAAYVNSL